MLSAIRMYVGIKAFNFKMRAVPNNLWTFSNKRVYARLVECLLAAGDLGAGRKEKSVSYLLSLVTIFAAYVT